MKIYYSYFKLRFLTGLQYRAAALAGICTQLFFGFVYIFVYIAFYESNNVSKLPMKLPQLISYVWLGQIFFSIIYLWYKDKEILNTIKNGNIAYELCRPQNLYKMWMAKLIGDRLSSLFLRTIPLILILILIPTKYSIGLPISIEAFILFIITLIFSIFLMASIILLYEVICLFTIDEKGVVNILMVIADILSGLIVPIPFFPKFFQNIANLLPFRYVSDLPFRIYIGNITINEGIGSLFIQIFWIVLLFVIGNLLLKKALKRVVIQGG